MKKGFIVSFETKMRSVEPRGYFQDLLSSHLFICSLGIRGLRVAPVGHGRAGSALGEVLLVLGRRRGVEVEIPMQRVEGVLEEQGHEAVGPRVSVEEVQHFEGGAGQAEALEELELEVGLR